MEKGFNTKRFLITLSFVLVTALAVGGATYYVMNEQNKDDKAALQSQIDEQTTTEECEECEVCEEKTAYTKPSKDADDVVTEFVGKYLANTSGNYDSYYSDKFEKYLEDFSGNYSPIIFAQDTPTKYPVVHSETSSDNGTAKVIVYFNYGDFSSSSWNVMYILDNVDGNWLIDETKSLRKDS